ncbi:MAG: T9SS type A sorting domain-containing protein [Flavobacteriales bacterium]|jgi:hypothetical protein
MVRMRCFLVLVGLLSLGATRASTCTTVASGPFTDVNVWDCGCDPIACDTLIIAHAVTLDSDLEWNGGLFHITPTGSLTGQVRLIPDGDLINEGSINVHRVRTLFGHDTKNLGTMACTVFVVASDSTINRGELICTDSLTNSWIRPLFNEGSISSPVIYSSGFFSNSGATSCNTLKCNTIYNGGTVTVEDSLTCTSLRNDSNVVSHHLIARSIDNSGSIELSGTLKLGGLSSGDTRLQANSTIRTRDFINSAGSEIRGPGQLCIEGHAENHGVLRGSLVICDLSPTMDVPPYMDVNTGTFWISVTYCANSSCSWTSVSDEASSPAVHISPNPAVDALTIQLGASLPTVHRIEIRDLGGRLVQQVEEPIMDRIVLHRNGLVAGTYLIRVIRTNGEVMATQMVVFTD